MYKIKGQKKEFATQLEAVKFAKVNRIDNPEIRYTAEITEPEALFYDIDEIDYVLNNTQEEMMEMSRLKSWEALEDMEAVFEDGDSANLIYCLELTELQEPSTTTLTLSEAVEYIRKWYKKNIVPKLPTYTKRTKMYTVEYTGQVSVEAHDEDEAMRKFTKKAYMENFKYLELEAWEEEE